MLLARNVPSGEGRRETMFSQATAFAVPNEIGKMILVASHAGVFREARVSSLPGEG